MIRILQVHAMPLFSRDYYSSIDRAAVQFDFLTWEGATNLNAAYVKSLGGRVYVSKYYKSDKVRYIFELSRILKTNNYDIVHSHASFNNIYTVIAGVLAGTPVRISHSHSAYEPHGFFRAVLRKFAIVLINTLSTDRWACSSEAARCMFENHPNLIVHNAIDTSRFRFDSSTRQKYREALGLGDTLVLCHVGFLGYPKNQKFLLRVFVCIKKKRPDALLMLVGSGQASARAEIESLIDELHIETSVRMLGQRSDVNGLMQAADIFALPSEFEGLGIVLVEAQAAGLPCFASDVITREVALTNLIHFLPLSLGPRGWADAILAEPIDGPRTSCAATVAAAGYELQIEANKLVCYYQQALRKALKRN